MPKNNQKNNQYQAKRNNLNDDQSQKDANKKVAKMAAKAAADYYTGGKGGAVVDKLANTKLGDKALEKMGNSFAKQNPGLAKATKKLNDIGVLDKADQALSLSNGNKSTGDIENNVSNSSTGKIGTGLLDSSSNKSNNSNESETAFEDGEADTKGTGSVLETLGINGSSITSLLLKNKYAALIGFVIILMLSLLMIVGIVQATEGDKESGSVTCTTDSKLLSIAEGEVGNNEANGTHSKYLSYLGFSPSTAWCAAFVTWCAKEAGIEESVIPHTASVSTFLEYFKKAGVFHEISSDYKPIPGNLIIWKAKGRSHIGIVKEYDSSSGVLKTVEGNSSDAVRINTYQYSNLEANGVVGFASPQQEKCTDTTDGDNATTIQNGESITLPNNLGTYATREFDLAVTASEISYARSMAQQRRIVNPYAFPEKTNQRKVQDAWIKAGAKHDSKGFCKLEGRYLVATTTTYGSVGEKVDFYMSSGKIIHVILTDAKSQSKTWYDQHPADKWGHASGKNVLEFLGKNSIGDNPYYALGLNGQTVVKAVNGGSIFK